MSHTIYEGKELAVSLCAGTCDRCAAVGGGVGFWAGEAQQRVLCVLGIEHSVPWQGAKLCLRCFRLLVDAVLTGEPLC